MNSNIELLFLDTLTISFIHGFYYTIYCCHLPKNPRFFLIIMTKRVLILHRVNFEDNWIRKLLSWPHIWRHFSSCPFSSRSTNRYLSCVTRIIKESSVIISLDFGKKIPMSVSENIVTDLFIKNSIFD